MKIEAVYSKKKSTPEKRCVLVNLVGEVQKAPSQRYHYPL